MEIRQILTLRGPNIWANFPVLEAWVDLGNLKDSSSDSLPGFNQRLMKWLPSLVEHRCSVGERGGFFQRLERGTYLAHILEHVTLELQTLAGTPVGFGKARETSEEGVYKVAIRYRDEDLGKECLYSARALCLAAVHDTPFNVHEELARLRELADRICLGPSTAAVVDAARDRGIPFFRMNKTNLVMLGQGALQRRIWAGETDRTSAIAESIAQDKMLTKSLLAQAGIPVPVGRTVESADDAWEAAEDIGLPVVVKPLDANHGRGVCTDLQTEAQVRSAYASALEEGSGVLVEQFALGFDHRILVVGDHVVAATRGEPTYVTGDGRRSIAQLIDEDVNQDIRRGELESFPLCEIELDPTILLQLSRQGFTQESVPRPGERVLIQRNGNLSFDVTDDVHPEVAAQAIQAARVVGLDIAGLDLVMQDISQPLESQGGVVVEVNAGPGLLMHLKPLEGKPRPVGEAIIECMFGEQSNGRIPVVAIAGSTGGTQAARLIHCMLNQTGKRTGLVCSTGHLVGEREIAGFESASGESLRAMLLNPLVEAVVCEAIAENILHEGLGVDRCQIGVVLHIDETERVPHFGIDSAENMATVYRTVVDVVLPTGFAVLNADELLVAEMAASCRGQTILFSQSSASAAVTGHRERGGRVVFVENDQIVLAEGPQVAATIGLNCLPLSVDQTVKTPQPTYEVLATIGAAWAADVPVPVIQEVLVKQLGIETCAGAVVA